MTKGEFKACCSILSHLTSPRMVAEWSVLNFSGLGLGLVRVKGFGSGLEFGCKISVQGLSVQFRVSVRV